MTTQTEYHLNQNYLRNLNNPYTKKTNRETWEESNEAMRGSKGECRRLERSKRDKPGNKEYKGTRSWMGVPRGDTDDYSGKPRHPLMKEFSAVEIFAHTADCREGDSLMSSYSSLVKKPAASSLLVRCFLSLFPRHYLPPRTVRTLSFDPRQPSAASCNLFHPRLPSLVTSCIAELKTVRSNIDSLSEKGKVNNQRATSFSPSGTRGLLRISSSIMSRHNICYATLCLKAPSGTRGLSILNVPVDEPKKKRGNHSYETHEEYEQHELPEPKNRLCEPHEPKNRLCEPHE